MGCEGEPQLFFPRRISSLCFHSTKGPHGTRQRMPFQNQIVWNSKTDCPCQPPVISGSGLRQSSSIGPRDHLPDPFLPSLGALPGPAKLDFTTCPFYLIPLLDSSTWSFAPHPPPRSCLMLLWGHSLARTGHLHTVNPHLYNTQCFCMKSPPPPEAGIFLQKAPVWKRKQTNKQ